MKEFKFPALAVSQEIGHFYICVMGHKDLIAVSSSDIRRLKDSEFDEYIGIQRRLNPSRMKEIRDYVNSYDASFPTSVILAVESESALYDPDEKILELLPAENSDSSDIAVIIDGQHRIEGLKAFKKDRFEVPVCVFVGADMQTKASIFATVNLAQTKVNRSLAYDLLAYEKKDTPQKVCHRIAVSLDRMKESPLNQRIKRLGVATEGRTGETLTQATVVEALLPFISDDPLRDRNDLWRFNTRRELQSADLKRHPFRRIYLSGDEGDILANLINYFIAVKRRYPSSWERVKEKGNVLPKTNGFRALMRALRIVYPTLRSRVENEVLRSDDYMKFLNLVQLDDDQFTTETFPPGTSGEAKLFGYLEEATEEL